MVVSEDLPQLPPELVPVGCLDGNERLPPVLAEWANPAFAEDDTFAVLCRAPQERCFELITLAAAVGSFDPAARNYAMDLLAIRRSAERARQRRETRA